jgi:hypothetical protein
MKIHPSTKVLIESLKLDKESYEETVIRVLSAIKSKSQ